MCAGGKPADVCVSVRRYDVTYCSRDVKTMGTFLCSCSSRLYSHCFLTFHNVWEQICGTVQADRRCVECGVGIGVEQDPGDHNLLVEWWWLFHVLRRFGGKVRRIIPKLRFKKKKLNMEINSRAPIPLFRQDHSIVAQRAETTVDERFPLRMDRPTLGTQRPVSPLRSCQSQQNSFIHKLKSVTLLTVHVILKNKYLKRTRKNEVD